MGLGFVLEGHPMRVEQEIRISGKRKESCFRIPVEAKKTKPVIVMISLTQALI